MSDTIERMITAAFSEAGALRFREAAVRARAASLLSDRLEWCALFDPATNTACIAIVGPDGIERINAMSPVSEPEATDWFHATVAPEPGGADLW